MVDAPTASPGRPDLDAAEYVLGTLDREERRDFLRRVVREPDTAQEVVAWRERLAPLDDLVAEVPPPASLWPRIERTVSDAPPAANDNRGMWRPLAIAASLVAIVSTGFALRERPAPVATPPARTVTPVALQTSAVAALSPDGKTPGLFLTYDRTRNALRVVPVGLTADPRHSFELWLIEGKNAPRSMAVIRPDGETPVEHLRIDPSAGLTFAVSIEPLGGSPTGLPTGPVVYSGKLVPFPHVS